MQANHTFWCFSDRASYHRLVSITNLMHNSFILQQYICYIIILDMFRAVLCSSSGGHIVLFQHLVSSLSVNGCTVRRLRANSALNRHTIRPFTESDDTRCCNNTIWPTEDEHGTARNMSRIIMQHIYGYRIKELCIKLVIETSLIIPVCILTTLH
jgi:hypothetical protein